MREKDDESIQDSNTEILPENNQELHATTQSAPHDDDEKQSGSPTIQLEVNLGNNVVDLPKDKDMDDDVISALRELDQDLGLKDGMEISTFLDWLLQSMEKKKMIEAQPTKDIDDFLVRFGKEKEQKKAKVFLKITRDDTGVRIAQVAVLMGNKTRDVVTPMHYQVNTIDFGPTTQKQEFQELDDMIKAIEARLNRTIEKKDMLECENRRLKQYIEGMKSQRCKNLSFVSPIAIDRGFPFDYKAARNTHQEVGKWIEDISKQAEDFLAQFFQALDKTSMLIFKMQHLEGVWDDFQPVKEKAIPHLKVLKRIPTPTLIQEGVIQAGDVYDFQGWYYSLAMQRSSYDHARQECTVMEGSIQENNKKSLLPLKNYWDWMSMLPTV